jgi:hypothetical protein
VDNARIFQTKISFLPDGYPPYMGGNERGYQNMENSKKVSKSPSQVV